MTNQEITKTIKTLVWVEGKYTLSQIIKDTGMVRSTFYSRLKNDSWTKTEILALKYLGILKD